MVDVPDERREPALEEVFYPTDRVPFVEWEQFSGARPTVVLTGAITLLAFVTGLSNLSQPTFALDGPLTAVVTVPVGFARFSGVLFAFVLGLVTVGLQRRKRLAWRAAVLALPGLALLPLATLQTTDVPLLVLVVVAVPSLVWNRAAFDQPVDLSPLQIASLAAMVGVGLYGVVGSYTLRGQFLELDTWSDAVYYVIVTIATVGYGDITPTTVQARWFSLSVILFGTGAFTVAVGALIVPVIESRMATAFGIMTAAELTLLEDHVVVLGYGDVTESLLNELRDETDVVVVTDDAETAAALQTDGVSVLTEDPTDESVLSDARVDTARGVVVGSNDDARDVLAVIAAKNVAPDVRVVAAATEEKHVDKFDSVGADEVLNPRTIGGRLLGRSVLGEVTTLSVTDDAGPERSTDPDGGDAGN
ncbi:NAD-binding protein [Haloarcula pellucida]|uniref:Potassium channel protein n=1 Tax=Haloarcula pellucida TaxID=1427151 RepID=A0A830GN54_9EURY|nr:NAD-binding protein [Halomicroarcula pellucida]MBX0349823.1 NAD-binding protein [Halomicroarcula pellucida]GGN94536.1 potassium channel protein [Halomicroarcula pellucida]